MRTLLCLYFLAAGFAGMQAQNNPIAYDVSAQQRAKSTLVDVYFTVKDPDNERVYVSLMGSSNNGVTWDIGLTNVSGDTGLVRTGVRRRIVWDASTDYAKQYSANFRIMVVARDHLCPVVGDEGMVYIAGGTYHVRGKELNLKEYCIDRYEFPNIKGNMPTVYVNYEGASDSCRLLGKRLCSENQWELACMGRNGQLYPYGEKYNRTKCNTQGDSIRPIGAGSRCVSTFGVYDLSGNVYEWISDSYMAGDQPEANSEAAPSVNAEAFVKRGMRGGNYYLGSKNARCDHRQWEWPNYSNRLLGFRCCYSFPGR